MTIKEFLAKYGKQNPSQKISIEQKNVAGEDSSNEVYLYEDSDLDSSEFSLQNTGSHL